MVSIKVFIILVENNITIPLFSKNVFASANIRSCLVENKN